jgi:hypothetical protein
MAAQPEKVFYVLEFHSAKPLIPVKREFGRKFEKDPPTANSIRRWLLCIEVAPVRGKRSG